MDWEQRCIRVCAASLLCSLFLRMITIGAFSPLGQMLRSEEAISFYLYLQTGRAVRLRPEAPELSPIIVPTDPAPTVPEIKRPVFRASDAQSVDVTYSCDYKPDMGALLAAPLEWDLTSGTPSVLILHTHATESFTKTDGDRYKETTAYRTLDEQYNMLCLGDLIARRLEEAGISVIHDTALHDYPSYNNAYPNAGASTAAYLERYPGIQLIIDLHRDAADTPYGQMVTQCSIGSETAAQIMMVVGTDGGGLYHPDWKQNLSVALKLQVLLENDAPGICRNLKLTRSRYNQHLGNTALLIEIGAAGNTLHEARLAAEKLAQAIIRLKHGSTTG